MCCSPGEVLPRFPSPTHAQDPIKRAVHHLAPLTTVNDVIKDLPPGDPHHDVERAQQSNGQRPPYDANAPLSRCITTSGGQNYHPSGRDFTLREYACLQGFPRRYQFVGGITDVKRQIGNAVPPSVGKIFLAEFKRALMEADNRR